MKGGVGKTTTAVNLSYLAAAAGQRTLLWDLDPQARRASPSACGRSVAGFGRKSLEGGQALAAAIKETDYDNLDLLPADFAYRKFDRLLDSPRQAGTRLSGAPRHARPRLRRRVPRLPGGLFAADRGRLRCRRRDTRADHSDRAVAANGCTADQVGRPLRRRRRTGGVLQHGGSPQDAAPASLRVVERTTPRCS